MTKAKTAVHSTLVNSHAQVIEYSARGSYLWCTYSDANGNQHWRVKTGARTTAGMERAIKASPQFKQDLRAVNIQRIFDHNMAKGKRQSLARKGIENGYTLCIFNDEQELVTKLTSKDPKFVNAILCKADNYELFIGDKLVTRQEFAVALRKQA